MAESKADFDAKRAEDVQKEYEDAFEESQKAAIDAREDQPDNAETEEEYYARIASVPGIFGDVDTTSGAGASGTDVVSKNNELATVAVAEKDAAAEAGDEEAEAASDDEARRQVDAAAGTTGFADEVDEAADDQDDDDDDSEDEPVV